MKKAWEVIKKVLVWLGTIIAAVTAICFCKKLGSSERIDSDEKEDADEINRKAAAKREEAVSRISNTDARTLCESYGSVCDTISDGKERFRRRCKRTDN
ncbi:hypothetical protein [Treponema bryantii]|uniref:hypothetical protein n=1 Tax=Treponema bryantii TaxID=163 RepID=UPI002B294EBF|nr:hypothetical protein TRBR_14620 [Treponema bryantii]